MNANPDPLLAVRRSDSRRWIPWFLVGLRIVLGPLSILIVWCELPRWIWLLQFAIAILSDIYDGKLARRWGVATASLRRADSIADDIYAFASLACFWIAEPGIVINHIWGIAVVAGLDLARAPMDWFLFGRKASYHAYSARLFGISLIPVGILLMGFGTVSWCLWFALAIGLYSELEGIAISMILPHWTHDVKHLGIALTIRREASAGRLAES